MLVYISCIELFWIFCVILAVEECSDSTALKTQKPTFIYIMGRQSTKPLHSVLLLVCFIHLQWNESQLQQNNPLWCSSRWPHLQNLMLKATENIGKVGKNIFMLKATIHNDLWIEGNLSAHSKRLFCWRRCCQNSGRTNFITWVILYSEGFKHSDFQKLWNAFYLWVLIMFKTSFHFRKIGLSIASRKWKF